MWDRFIIEIQRKSIDNKAFSVRHFYFLPIEYFSRWKRGEVEEITEKALELYLRENTGSIKSHFTEKKGAILFCFDKLRLSRNNTTRKPKNNRKSKIQKRKFE